MKAKISPLSWLNFALLQSNFQFVQPEVKPKKKKINPADFFRNYVIDIDFDIQDTNPDEFQVFTKIDINTDESLIAGYKISVEGAGVFRINPNEALSEAHRDNLRNYSAVNLLINRLRTHILQTTSLSVFGPYDLPPIDITDLFVQKSERV
ncbi:protein-export chaperone SecB [Pararcticibacter amylolyticus]|uniref:Preprotein translocase subunit SecB n=1 Tax=Pararcticibacter amylolyticus TaxID=2173175 RepID=A0A2U2PGW8_9SPHI|nr:protein-export chaperone SecB [Pararcticibacter amylolyticus]PWG80651.1 preprotein translocase subunit SecB [Pararcticibacter amylolyticus]